MPTYNVHSVDISKAESQVLHGLGTEKGKLHMKVT